MAACRFNRGKQGITLNYGTAEGLKIMKQLLSTADVFITNVRNKSLIKAGLDYESLKGEFPTLVYGHLSAWGLDGPQKDDPGYDFGAFWGYKMEPKIVKNWSRKTGYNFEGFEGGFDRCSTSF